MDSVMNTRYFFVLVVMVLGLLTLVEAEAWDENNFPNPRKHVEECKQERESLVCDPDEMLTAAQRKDLTKLVMNIWKTSECPCAPKQCDGSHSKRGLPIAFAVMETYNESQPLGDLAMKLRDQNWKSFGTEGCENLFVVALVMKIGFYEESKVAIARGNVFSDKGMDENCVSYLESHANKMYFKKNNAYFGLDLIAEKLQEFYEDPEQCAKEPFLPLTNFVKFAKILKIVVGVVFFVILITVICCCVYCFRCKKKRENHLQTLE